MATSQPIPNFVSDETWWVTFGASRRLQNLGMVEIGLTSREIICEAIKFFRGAAAILPHIRFAATAGEPTQIITWQHYHKCHKKDTRSDAEPAAYCAAHPAPLRATEPGSDPGPNRRPVRSATRLATQPSQPGAGGEEGSCEQTPRARRRHPSGVKRRCHPYPGVARTPTAVGEAADSTAPATKLQANARRFTNVPEARGGGNRPH